jgi:hypothetical protein
MVGGYSIKILAGMKQQAKKAVTAPLEGQGHPANNQRDEKSNNLIVEQRHMWWVCGGWVQHLGIGRHAAAAAAVAAALDPQGHPANNQHDDIINIFFGV